MISRNNKKEPAAPIDPMAPLRELQGRIDAFRQELEGYIDARCREIKAGADGVPLDSIKMMVAGRSNCHCLVANKILNDRAAEIELERKHNESQSRE